MLTTAPGLMAAFLVLVFVALAFEAVAEAPGLRIESAATSAVFAALTFAAFAAAGFSLLGRARFGDEGLWVAIGFGWITYAVGVVGLGEFVPAVGGSARLAAARAVMLALTTLVLSDAVHSSVRTRGGRIATGYLGGLLAVLVLIGGLLPGVWGLLSPGALIALALTFAIAGHHLRLQALRWFAVVVVGLALAELALGAIDGQPAVWALAAGAVRIVGLLFAMLAVAAQLMSAYSRRVEELASVSSSVDLLEQSAMHAARAAAERRHEASSALAAMECGLRAMRRDATSTDPDAVQQAMAAELAMLRRIVAAEELEATVDFSVHSMAAGVIVAQRLAGADIVEALSNRLIAHGNPSATAEALQVVLDNARQHAPGSAVSVFGRRVGSTVEIRVEDTGDGVSDDIASRVFERNVGTRDSGLGLFIAQRLMEGQQGGIALDLSSESGASFVLTLPAAQTLHQGDQGTDRLDSDDFVDTFELDNRHQRSLAALDQSNNGAGEGG